MGRTGGRRSSAHRGESEGSLGSSGPHVPEPDANREYHATDSPTWDAVRLEALVQEVRPKGVERATRRFERKMSERIHSDATLENASFTHPEVRTLLSGRHTPGHTEGEELMIQDMKVASETLIDFVAEGPQPITQDLSDELHLFLGRHTNVPSMEMRADWPGRSSGPRVALGDGIHFKSLGRKPLRRVFDDGVQTISRIEHPLVRGAIWAAFATYHQFYWDANKRTGRYVMNSVAISHGYDSITIPADKSEEYFDGVVLSYKSGDLTPHIRFLLEQYDDH